MNNVTPHVKSQSCENGTCRFCFDEPLMSGCAGCADYNCGFCYTARFTPKHQRTYLRPCGWNDDEGVMALPPLKMGTVGKIWEDGQFVDAIVLADCGSCDGGGDDIKICARNWQRVNDWWVGWIGALEFILNE